MKTILNIWVLWAVIASIPLACDVRIGVAKELQFAGRAWTVKEAATPVGPGPNRFSGVPEDVWVDDKGLHLTVHKKGEHWYSTEVILNENLGYGTYLFQTNSRQDLLDDNVVFGAFTWDDHGDDERIPDCPNREIDFEDSRWAERSGPNSQIVVQPGKIPGNHFQFDLPDLSNDAILTRYFAWAPEKVEFVSIHGNYTPETCPETAVFHRHTYVENEAAKNIVPHAGRERFHFNLWLYKPEPVDGRPAEVIISEFSFTPEIKMPAQFK